MGIGNEISLKSEVGAKTDYVEIPHSLGESSALALLNTGYYHIHGTSFLYPDKAPPISLTASASAWGETGSIVEIIPANANARAFDIHWASITSISGVLDGVIDIFSGDIGSEVKITSIAVTRTANFSRESETPVQIPQQSANTRISARFSTSTLNADTVNIKLYGHFYGEVL